jgi:hypothetical protein
LIFLQTPAGKRKKELSLGFFVRPPGHVPGPRAGNLVQNKDVKDAAGAKQMEIAIAHCRVFHCFHTCHFWVSSDI